MTKTKLLVLDKDGTLVRPKSGNTFVQHPEDQELIEGVAEAIQRYVADGWQLAIASNQGGVAAGYKSLDDAIAEMQYAMKLTGIPDAYFCPDMEGISCLWVNEYRHVDIVSTFKKYEELSGSYRKPAGGMLRLAGWRMQSGYNCRLEIEVSLMIGDRPEDEQAAQAAGFDFLWADEWRKSN